MDYLIEVTKNDIRLSHHCIHITRTKENCAYCPVSRACKRVLKDRFLKVMHDCILTKKHKVYSLPKKAQLFIKAFDLGLPVHPIKFKITLTNRKVC